MRREIERILEQLRRSFERESWHGPAVLELLADVTTDEALARPPGDGHSIAELTLHMATWKQAVTERIQGRAMDPTPAEDWPVEEAARASIWPEARNRLERAHRALVAAASALKDEDLDRPGAGPTPRYVLLHGAIQHDLYHAGQIAVIAKLLRAR